jgi:outer membrane lipoprotein-sorting protein
MKKILLGLAFISTVFVTNAQDITVDELISSYLENIGGEEALAKVENFTMSASMNMQGMDLPLEIVETKDGKKLTKFTFQGQEMVQEAYDGETMWGVNFMTMKAEKSDSEKTENHQRSIGEFPDVFLTYKEMGYTIELDGEENQEGVDCYKVKVTKKTQLADGEEVDNIVYYYMDKEAFVPIMVEQEIPGGEMAGQISQTLFSDYQEVDGIYFPFSITFQVEGMGGQTIEIESMELNTEIDDSIFVFEE